jgi:hypothetical protein
MVEVATGADVQSVEGRQRLGTASGHGVHRPLPALVTTQAVDMTAVDPTGPTGPADPKPPYPTDPTEPDPAHPVEPEHRWTAPSATAILGWLRAKVR